MSKLIESPKECGVRLLDLSSRKGNYLCIHLNRPKMDTPCNSSDEFPEWCPLQEGIPIPKSGSTEPSCGNTHKHTYYKNGKRVYLRRNRKNCIYYINGSRSHVYRNKCRYDFIFHLTKCKGVTCGHYKTE